jgi:hypothetical protein
MPMFALSSAPRRLFRLLTRSRRLLFTVGLVMLLCASVSTALAQSALPTPQTPQHFSSQARIGFPSGDDWEPSITADRYGHVYALYKHYDVSGGQTCAGCDVHLLFQRSGDQGAASKRCATDSR